MNYSVIWSDKAKANYKLILNHLETEWTQREVNNFIKKTEEAITLIQAGPLLYKSSSKSKIIRPCVLVKLVSLFYKIEQNTVCLITFWDNRQHTRRLKS